MHSVNKFYTENIASEMATLLLSLYVDLELLNANLIIPLSGMTLERTYQRNQAIIYLEQLS